jgi:hypothetical protein
MNESCRLLRPWRVTLRQSATSCARGAVAALLIHDWLPHAGWTSRSACGRATPHRCAPWKARRRSRSWTTTGKDATMAKQLKPMHPGEALREGFLVPLEMSAGVLAKSLRLASHTDRSDCQRTDRLYCRHCASARNGTALARSPKTTMTFRSRSGISARFSIVSSQ